MNYFTVTFISRFLFVGVILVYIKYTILCLSQICHDYLLLYVFLMLYLITDIQLL